MHRLISTATILAAAAVLAAWLPADIRAQSKPSLTGAWTLNKDLSDQPPERGDQGNDAGRRRGGGGFGRGAGFGGGRRMGGRGGGSGGAQMDPEAMARMREAMRDIMQPSEHLTITQSDQTIVITSAEGRTTRLSTDGSKIKDENTNIERRTKWDGDRLVSAISGVGPGKITQTYAVDPEHHQLRITTNIERGRQGQARTITHVYDAESSS